MVLGSIRCGFCKQRNATLCLRKTNEEYLLPRTVESKNFIQTCRLFLFYFFFSECPCYDQVIPVLLSEGIDGVASKCKLTPGIPLKPMLAHPTKGVSEVLSRFENAKFTCEWKYDGERAQIHLLEDGSIRIYSRNQEDNTTKYPDIIQRFQNCKLDSVKSCVLDSEAVAWDREKKQIQPFQVDLTSKNII